MGWYWVPLIVVVVQAVFLLLLWLALRKTVGQIPFKELQESERKKYEDQIEAEKVARGKAEQELYNLAAEQKKIVVWWSEAKEKVNREVQENFNKLVSDPDAMDRKLDDLLASNGGTTTRDTEEGG